MSENQIVSPNVSDLVMDIPVALSVELGRTQMPVREIMAINPGSVIELEKPSDEPVDLCVNGRLVGRGEVVVVNNVLGIKVTELVNK